MYETLLSGSAQEILKFAETGNEGGKVSKVDEAVAFLTAILANGPLSFPEIEAQANEARITPSALKRAKMSLGIESQKMTGLGQSSSFSWSMPHRMSDAMIPQFSRGYFNAAPSIGSHASVASVASVAPVAPVEPVEPVEPVINEQMVQHLITECRKYYVAEKSRAPSKNLQDEEIEDECLEQHASDMRNIINDVVDEYLSALGSEYEQLIPAYIQVVKKRMSVQ